MTNNQLAVKVKPLVWAADETRPETSWTADTPWGRYRVFQAWWGKMDKWGWVCTQSEEQFFHTLESAQAAAQADYDRIIRSALEPSSAKPETWQTIDNAPIHESIILCFWWSHAPDQAFRCEGYIDRDKLTWRLQNGEKIGSHLTGPTHWMRMPDAPKPEGK